MPRNGIRLKLHHLLFSYDSPVGSGKATIADISISGCAVENATLPLPVGLVIEGMIGFDQHPSLIGSVQMKSRVVRSDGKHFAVQFIELASDFQEQLFQRFLHEVTRARIDV